MDVRLSISVAELDRCKGRCLQAADLISEPTLKAFLEGAAAAFKVMQSVEFGDNEEHVLSRVTTRFGGEQ